MASNPGRWYWRPMLDLGFTQVRLSAFSEHGAGADNLLARNSEDAFVNLRPGLEMGFETALGESLARWYARVGINRYIVGGKFDVDVMTGNDITLRVGYSGQFSASGTTHGATLKFSRDF